MPVAAAISAGNVAGHRETRQQRDLTPVLHRPVSRQRKADIAKTRSLNSSLHTELAKRFDMNGDKLWEEASLAVLVS
jgi:hypothetical protein